MGLLVIAAVVQQSDDNDEGRMGLRPADSGPCETPADAWLDTLQSAFFREHRDAAITDSAYIEHDTAGGVAYYVAVTVEGVSGVAVFGTSDPPLQADPGLMAASNFSAKSLSDLGADISRDSPAGLLLLDLAGTSVAESCLA